MKHFAQIMGMVALVMPQSRRILYWSAMPAQGVGDFPMSKNSPPASARIYQFPARGSARPVRALQASPTTTDPRRELPAVEFGSGWYHEAAVQAETLRKS
jgi:hypothetical protein